MLWNKTEFHEHHQHVKHNFIINDYQKWYPDLDPDQNLAQSKDSNRLIENCLFQIFFSNYTFVHILFFPHQYFFEVP